MTEDPLDENIKIKEESEDIELLELLDQTLISKLDSLKANGKLDKKYSEIYSGGVYALRGKNRRENPDWMSQSANSFREILYILQKIEDKEMKELLNDYFAKSLTPKQINEYKSYLANLYKLFNDLTHHFSKVQDVTTQKYLINKNLEIGINPLTKEDYFQAIKFYKEYLKLLVTTALEMHKKIDKCIAAKSKNKNLVRVFFNNSRDSKIYFLSLADESWLSWLWTNGFFVDLKKTSEDPTTYSFRMPELDYLVRVAEKNPKIVSDIIKSIPISEVTFNPEVVDRFFWIIGSLPIDQVKVLLPKILKENWAQLMAPFNRSGYEYKRLVERIRTAKDFEAANSIAEIILTPRVKEEILKMDRFYISDKLFYLNDISETDIFDVLTDSANDKKEESLQTVLNSLGKIVKLGKENEEYDVFEESEPFYLLDIDLFSLELDSGKRWHPREDIQNLVATAKILVQEIFDSVASSKTEILRLYKTYLEPLPDSHTLYRLKLFAATRYPTILREQVQEGLFRVFNTGERYTEVEGGAEYHQGLIASFAIFEPKIKRDYIKKVFEYFGASLEDKDKEKFRKRSGLEILTYIKKELTPDEVKKSKELFGDFPTEDPIPHINVSHSRSGSISPKSPVNLPDFNIQEIIEHLKTDWSPKVLKEQFEHDDFFSPRGAEGLGDAIKEDFKNRMLDYFKNLKDFFNRESIDPSYIYSILREVDEMLRNKKTLTDGQYIELINFFNLIRLSGEEEEFEKSSEKSWLADWIAVHKIMADILLNIMATIKDSQVFKDNRDILFLLVKYLMSIKVSPDAEDDKRESELAHVALNSVRGQAFRAFVQFTYSEGNNFLAEDVKALYEQILDNDSSNAVRFTIGQFFASFYFRDIPFVTRLLPKIFPMGQRGKEKLYFSTWEGYLTSSVYKELFEALKDYYAYAITLKTEDYPNRKYLKNLDETLAGHLVLAYVHFGLKPGDTLFDSFWSTPNEVRHYEFASFIGRHYLTRDEASGEWLEESKVDKQKLVDFWNWMLKTDLPIEPKAFSGFGFWINPNKEIIEDVVIVENMATTLKKSNGEIDWDYGLFHRIKEFAEINPEKALEIMKSLLLLNDNLNPNHRMYFDANNQFKEPLEIVYKNDALKKPVENFVNALIEKGSHTFWGLKDVIK